MTKNRPAIVIVAYNRASSLKRLLSSIQSAYYPNNQITLIISIDKRNNNSDVLEVAQNFTWEFGTKEVRYQEKNLGLRKHVIKCGDLTNEYGAIIMLEDDLYVSPNFYNYTQEALNFVSKDEKIGGISLFNHQLNNHIRKNFEPIQDGYDNWYFQFAASWGQAWNKEQWGGFKSWYATNPKINSIEEVPKNVRAWSDKSWLKYFITYLILKDKFFLYPKISLSTNFSDAGTHATEDSTIFQAPLLYAKKVTYNFSNLNQSNAIYDAYYENILLANSLDIPKEKLSINLYGFKNMPNTQNKPYFLTNKKLDFKIIASFGCSLKPIDANILHRLPGKDIFLYDIREKQSNPEIKENTYRKLVYNFKYMTLKEALVISRVQLLGKFQRLYKKIV